MNLRSIAIVTSATLPVVFNDRLEFIVVEAQNIETRLKSYVPVVCILVVYDSENVGPLYFKDSKMMPWMLIVHCGKLRSWCGVPNLELPYLEVPQSGTGNGGRNGGRNARKTRPTDPIVQHNTYNATDNPFFWT